MEIPFQSGRTYLRRQVWNALGLSRGDSKGGNYSTGYAWVGDCCVIFANVGTAGRTGHNYANAFSGDDMVWWSKPGRTLRSPEINRIRSPGSTLLVFHRSAERDPWTYWGVAKAEDQVEEMLDPKVGNLVKFRLRRNMATLEVSSERQREEVDLKEIKPDSPEIFADDAFASLNLHPVTENGRILRSHLVRERRASIIKDLMVERIRSRGEPIICEACGFHFRERYGVDFDFIEAHHRAPLGISDEVRQTVEADLALLCANCHRAIHRMDLSMTVERLAAIIQNRKNS